MDGVWTILYACYILMYGFIFDSANSCLQYGFESNKWQRDVSMEKMNLTGIVSFSTLTSQLQCSILCSTETTCIIFSFNKETELCRGYSALDNAKGANKYPNAIEPEIYSRNYDLQNKLTVHHTRNSFKGAASKCITECGQLLVLDKPWKIDYILRRTDLSTTYWIGLSDQQKEGEFLWVDGKPFVHYQKQITKGFNNFDGNQKGEKRYNADCIVLNPSHFNMYDVHCSKFYKFICEAY